jgi:hypothetical protein
MQHSSLGWLVGKALLSAESSSGSGNDALGAERVGGPDVLQQAWFLLDPGVVQL